VNRIGNARTWRDLMDDLTIGQIVDLEASEKRNTETPAQLLQVARNWIAHNLIQIECADVAAPADAVDTPLDWEQAGHGYRRGYTVQDRSAVRPDADELLFCVQVQGVQFSDGRITRRITALAELENITAVEARMIAAALLEAADALDDSGAADVL
jgi:hypothetical protein